MSTGRLRPIAPISSQDFARYIRACLPNTACDTIVVANSGGPDSTCLLFLLDRYVKEHERVQPRRVVSWSVDHNLQPDSAGWIAHTSKFAASLGIKHLSSKIEWGASGFPAKPESGGKLELAARNARYALLYKALGDAKAGIAAFGHHADDQVETAILRALKGSSELGLAGMKPFRRFGMGVGFGGMRKWIVRPLLEVSKDRILATCDEHKLDYVVDSTNFQPELTLRNAIRKAVEDRDVAPITRFDSSLTVDTIEERIRALSLSLDVRQGAQALRDTVRNIVHNVRSIEEETDDALHHCTLPSPDGAVVLSAARLRTVTDPLVQLSLVTRVLRYASPHPWGSLKAEANRQQRSLHQIRDKIFGLSAERPARFSAGADVLWTPSLATRKGIKLPGLPQLANAEIPGRDAQEVWVASRAPPIRRPGAQPSEESAIRMNITSHLRDPHSEVDILFDNRFLVSIRGGTNERRRLAALVKNRYGGQATTGSTDAAPSEGDTVWIMARGRYHQPFIFAMGPGVFTPQWPGCTVDPRVPGAMVFRTYIDPPEEEGIVPPRPLNRTTSAQGGRQWVRMRWIRPL